MKRSFRMIPKGWLKEFHDFSPPKKHGKDFLKILFTGGSVLRKIQFVWWWWWGGGIAPVPISATCPQSIVRQTFKRFLIEKVFYQKVVYNQIISCFHTFWAHNSFMYIKNYITGYLNIFIYDIAYLFIIDKITKIQRVLCW